MEVMPRPKARRALPASAPMAASVSAPTFPGRRPILKGRATAGLVRAPGHIPCCIRLPVPKGVGLGREGALSEAFFREEPRAFPSLLQVQVCVADARSRGAEAPRRRDSGSTEGHGSQLPLQPHFLSQLLAPSQAPPCTVQHLEAASPFGWVT